jgi:predicted nucleic acid-binding protein
MEALLEARLAVTHIVVIGELAVGNLSRRHETLRDLLALTRIEPSEPIEVLAWIEKHRMYGSGLSWGDAQLICSARERGVPLWSMDRRLEREAMRLGLGWLPPE